MHYRIIKGWRIFAWVILALFVAGGLFLVGKAFTEPSMNKQIVGIVGVSILIVGLIAIAWLDAIRTLIIVDDQSMSVTRVFTSRTALLKDIDGYRIGEKDAVFVELKDGGKKIRIPQYLERRKELIEWVKEKYEDLDVREKAAETEILLEDDRFGGTREEREARLGIAKKFDGAATVAGIGLLLWSFIYPQPFETLMILLFVAPWIAVGVTWYFKGLMKLYKVKKSPYPSMIQLMLMATVAVMVAVLRAYNLYGFGDKAWSMLIGGTIAGTVICIGACWQAIVASRKKAVTYIVVFVMAAVYSYSLLVFSNCYYDKSRATIYHVAVTGKRVSHGKSTSYYLSLSPWGRFEDGKEVTVSKGFYQSVNEDDSLSVFLQDGKWGVPWYRLRQWNKGDQ